MKPNPAILRATDYALIDVDAERDRQRALLATGRIPFDCAAPATSNGYKLGVLGEEYGEVCKEVNEMQPGKESLVRLKKELIQVAAVAVAWVEALQIEIDRQ